MNRPDHGLDRKRALFVFGACVALAGLVGLAWPRSLRLVGYMELGPLLTALELGALCALLAARLLEALRSRAVPAAALLDGCVAVFLVALIAVAVPGVLRVESDESNLLATSFGLLHAGTPEAFQSGVYDPAGVLEPRTAILDKRGYLFPMLLVPLHAALGFDAMNGVRFNLLAGALCLWFLIALSRPLLGGFAARAAACLLAATPAYALAVRSGGFDVANLAALLGALLALRAYLQRGATAWGWIAALAAALLAQLRYEAVLPAAAIALAAALHVARPDHRPASAWGWLPPLFAPLLLVPALWRQAVPMDLELPLPTLQAFSGANALENLRGFLGWLFFPDAGRQGLPLLGWLALLGCVQLGLGIARGARPRWRTIWWPVFVALAACLAITLCYWWGQARLAATARLFLPWIALAACVGALGLAKTGPRLAPALLLLIPLPALAWGLHAAASGEDLLQMKEALRVRAVEETLGQEAPGCRILVLDQRAGGFIVRGWSSLTPSDGMARWSSLESALREGTIERIAAVGDRPPVPEAATAGAWQASTPQTNGKSLLWWWVDPRAPACEGNVPAPSGIDAAAMSSALRKHAR